jgi:hypothetical protein
MNGAPLGHKRVCWKVIAGPAGENDDLETVGLLGKQATKPVHPTVVALDKLVVQDDRRAQIFREREPV